MSFLKNLISGGASELIGALGSVADNLSTSDEERLELKNQLTLIINAHAEKQMQHVETMEQELTKRHGADMTSDSWLSKNIRPLSLLFLTVATVLLAYLTIFMLPPEKLVLLQPWIALLTSLLLTVYGFYFGSRGLEKLAQGAGGVRAKIKTKIAALRMAIIESDIPDQAKSKLLGLLSEILE